jgi:hypothetical protein
VLIGSKRYKASPENILAVELVLLVKCTSVIHWGSPVKALNNRINIWLASSLVEDLPPTAWAHIRSLAGTCLSLVLYKRTERTLFKFLHNPIQKSEHVITRFYWPIESENRSVLYDWSIGPFFASWSLDKGRTSGSSGKKTLLLAFPIPLPGLEPVISRAIEEGRAVS